MHKEILDEKQVKLLSLLPIARKKWFYLVGGTGIALHIGHRKSIDFDLFRRDDFEPGEIDRILKNAGKFWSHRYIARTENHTGKIEDVNFTFFAFPFDVEATENFENYISLPDLLSLGAMKAYALGHRSKWKDYVDLYFILRDHHTISEISAKATEIFAWGYNESLFREQLCYFDDMNYSEEVAYLIPFPPTDEEVKRFLIEKALEN